MPNTASQPLYVAPYGYRLELEPAEQAIIKRIRKLKEKDWSLREIADRLNEDKVPYRKEYKWSHMTILRVIDPSYNWRA